MSLVHPDDALDDVLLLMQDDPVGLAAVVDGDGGLLGTVSDGDIRRAALAGAERDAPVSKVMPETPAVVPPDASDDDVRAILERDRLRGVLVADGTKVVGVRSAGDVGLDVSPATAVVLAGGRGQRLQPVTDTVPKPLLTVGRTTILGRQLEGLAEAGITDVYISVNYKAEAIEERIGDGSSYGLNVTYVREHKVLHTAGALSLLPRRPEGPLLVVNSKLVTSLNFARMVDFHRQEGAALTVGAMEYGVQVPYGVLRLDGSRVTAIDEKPTLRSLCSAGIYVLDPSLVDLVPRNTYFGMPDLIDKVIERGDRVSGFPIIEKIINISTREELEEALLYFATGEDV